MEEETLEELETWIEEEENFDYGTLIYQQDGKWGVSESKFNKAVPAIYDSIECIKGRNMFKVSMNGQYGVILVYEELFYVLNIEYDNVIVVNFDTFITEQDGEVCIKQDCLTMKLNMDTQYRPEFNIFKKDGKFGVKTSLDFDIIPAEYKEIHIIDLLQIIWGRKGWKWYLLYPIYKEEPINIVSEVKPEQLFQTDWIKVKVNGMYGVYEWLERRWALYPMYDFISEDPDNYCIVYRKDGVYKTRTIESSNDELESIF